MQRFDKFNSEVNGDTKPEDPIPTVENGAKTDASDTSDKKPTPDADGSALSDLDDSAPPKKKAKKSRTAEDEDAAYAAKLQAEENARTGRATRGGNTKRKAAPAPKKKAKKKSANRVKDEDDSDIGSGSGAEKKSPARKGGFHVRLPFCPRCTLH
jgi:upstream activation factor subunit UAF30